jgi:hypothetical protein
VHLRRLASRGRHCGRAVLVGDHDHRGGDEQLPRDRRGGRGAGQDLRRRRGPAGTGRQRGRRAGRRGTRVRVRLPGLGIRACAGPGRHGGQDQQHHPGASPVTAAGAGGAGIRRGVRARLERARITERYFYFQEISQNADRHIEKAPEGRIELVLPYDGDQYFSRQARKDVDHARQLGAKRATEALIGHLLLTGFEHADLDGLPDLGPTHGSVPIRVPITGLPGPSEPDPLITDRSACVVSHDYQPDTRHFKVEPVDVDAKLHDPDDALFSPSNVAGDFDGQRLRIMRQVGFRPEL